MFHIYCVNIAEFNKFLFDPLIVFLSFGWYFSSQNENISVVQLHSKRKGYFVLQFNAECTPYFLCDVVEVDVIEQIKFVYGFRFLGNPSEDHHLVVECSSAGVEPWPRHIWK